MFPLSIDQIRPVFSDKVQIRLTIGGAAELKTFHLQYCFHYGFAGSSIFYYQLVYMKSLPSRLYSVIADRILNNGNQQGTIP
jgi:hypothetical protein